MSEQRKGSTSNWLTHRGYWQAQGQPWRTEPEISNERKDFLEQRRSIVPDISRGVYPFKDIELRRDDIEWLLATHNGDHGPLDWNDKSQRKHKGLDLRGARLRRVDLSGLPLARLRGGLSWDEWRKAPREQIEAAAVNMERVLLEGAHLEGAELVGASLRDAYLSKVHLEEANLYEAHLEGANLRQAHLKGANLREARLERASLQEAYLEGANLYEARLGGSDLRKANLRQANLQEAHLEGTHLGEADLEEAELREAHLEMANLNKARLRKAQLTGAYLLWTNLSEACLEEAHLQESHLEMADLRGAHLEEADLRGANLKQTNFCKAYLRGARLAGAHLERANLQQAYLERANLQGVHMEQANLQDAYLGAADLRGAFFDIATNLQGVSFGDEKRGHSSLVDLHWEQANLSVVNWASVPVLGDERIARQSKQIHHYQEAARANHQLAVALDTQGLNDQAAYFFYRAHVLQRTIQRHQGKFGRYLFSLLLDLLAGYGYYPWRSIIVYLLAVASFAIGYYGMTHASHGASYSLTWYEALVLSISAFHGRGFFQPIQNLGDPVTILAMVEAIFGLLIEISFVAAFTQRFFGKK